MMRDLCSTLDPRRDGHALRHRAPVPVPVPVPVHRTPLVAPRTTTAVTQGSTIVELSEPALRANDNL